MKNAVLRYYLKGYNCSQCILKAAEAAYGVSASKSGMQMCQGVTTGFGVGEMCSALIACVMVLSLMFDEDTVKRLRIDLLTQFQDRHKTLHCGKLKSERTGRQCEKLIVEIGEMMDNIIENELNNR